ncbi:MAG: helix-turn-helix transcriptional regulator, partial [Clostridia bacterium]|nr:helix-turn-helix transcriptional regulator [Clostridia bacterium]
MADLKIPEVILRERRRKNMTQEELAASLGVSSQAISNWERGGYPDITLLPRIANYFGITVD